MALFHTIPIARPRKQPCSIPSQPPIPSHGAQTTNTNINTTPMAYSLALLPTRPRCYSVKVNGCAEARPLR